MSTAITATSVEGCAVINQLETTHQGQLILNNRIFTQFFNNKNKKHLQQKRKFYNKNFVTMLKNHHRIKIFLTVPEEYNSKKLHLKYEFL